MMRRSAGANLSIRFIKKHACDVIKRNKEVFDELAKR